jgi:hypothetical protein
MRCSTAAAAAWLARSGSNAATTLCHKLSANACCFRRSGPPRRARSSWPTASAAASRSPRHRTAGLASRPGASDGHPRWCRRICRGFPGAQVRRGLFVGHPGGRALAGAALLAGAAALLVRAARRTRANRSPDGS